ncbi:hypothetical protein [Bradyrhizobium sp.]|uniref:hypothetical protein n=1 Tax=Bradyrhizobium sp. TaxID=376 RepID=UPI002619B3B6|nr:hypothetical protein [Bradyrhizobium sp.]
MTSSTTVACWDKIFSVWALSLAAGIVMVGALAVWWAYFSRTTWSRSYLTVCVGLAVAMTGLIVWKDHQQSIRARNLPTLKAFNAEADQLFEESLRLDDDTDYPVYRAKADDFFKRLETWAADNLGPRASDVLRRDDPKNADNTFESALDKNHESSMTRIHQTRENIAALIGAGASESCVKPTAPELPVPQAEVRK